MKINELPTPCYVIDENIIEENCKVLADVMKKTGCHVLLAQKAFSNYALYPLIGKYLSGTTASGLYEARLGREEMGRENHVFAPAYKDEDMDELVKICDHIVFNSISQLERHKEKCRNVSIGIRVNPEFSTQNGHEIYDPCGKGSRLGVTANLLRNADLTGIDGLHFHTLCEQNSDDLKKTLDVVEEKFDFLLRKVKWVNFGGGHHITRKDYDVELLCDCITHIKEKYNVKVYIEPGEAVALNAGYFITTVLDKVKNSGITCLILDGSAACHMPDVLEMPYTPPLSEGSIIETPEKEFDYRLGGNTCLAGDIIGNYRFDHDVQIGERLTFCDMAIYSMVKNNTFNGIPLPSIYSMDRNGDCRLIKSFGYNDFKERLS
ncbi:carboxynorspermidine decarboxylase [Eshraghiella crossota]|uniref:carboxynorspermidine decarboxylase n=1 Tax=Eshraghiella crossota TaxID=45851 RepID=UPI003F81986A